MLGPWEQRVRAQLSGIDQSRQNKIEEELDYTQAIQGFFDWSNQNWEEVLREWKLKKEQREFQNW